MPITFLAPAFDPLSGAIAPEMPTSGAATLALVANSAYVARYVPRRPRLVSTIAFVCSTASGTDDPCEVGIYDAAGALLVTSGATTGKLNSTGLKTVTFAATALYAGSVYYLALASNSTATVIGASAASSSIGGLIGTAVPNLLQGIKATSYPLPATIAPSGTLSVPVMAVRES